MYECECGNYISPQRVQLGYTICLECGEKEAVRQRDSWTVVPLHKSSYTLITDPHELRGLNKYAN